MVLSWLPISKAQNYWASRAIWDHTERCLPSGTGKCAPH